MGIIRVPDVMKINNPEEYAEKFPEEKEKDLSISPSEQARLDVPKEEKGVEEIVQKPRPRGTGPASKGKKK